MKKCKLKEAPIWPCVFLNNKMVVCLFVDDMTVLYEYLQHANELIELLSESFDTKIVHDGNLVNNVAEYNILGVGLKYIHRLSMEFSMISAMEKK